MTTKQIIKAAKKCIKENKGLKINVTDVVTYTYFVGDKERTNHIARFYAYDVAFDESYGYVYKYNHMKDFSFVFGYDFDEINKMINEKFKL